MYNLLNKSTIISTTSHKHPHNCYDVTSCPSGPGHSPGEFEASSFDTDFTFLTKISASLIVTGSSVPTVSGRMMAVDPPNNVDTPKIKKGM